MPPMRPVTSAVGGMTVSEVRADLDCVRRYWKQTVDGSERGFDINHALTTGKYPLQEFCFLFVLGHHMKRHRKNAPPN